MDTPTHNVESRENGKVSLLHVYFRVVSEFFIKRKSQIMLHLLEKERKSIGLVVDPRNAFLQFY